jgi:hypothetical protein
MVRYGIYIEGRELLLQRANPGALSLSKANDLPSVSPLRDATKQFRFHSNRRAGGRLLWRGRQCSVPRKSMNRRLPSHNASYQRTSLSAVVATVRTFWGEVRTPDQCAELWHAPSSRAEFTCRVHVPSSRAESSARREGQRSSQSIVNPMRRSMKPSLPWRSPSQATGTWTAFAAV